MGNKKNTSYHKNKKKYLIDTKKSDVKIYGGIVKTSVKYGTRGAFELDFE